MSHKRLYIVDGAGYYYRAFYGVKQNLTSPDGRPTNAVFGIAKMFMQIIRDEKPDYLAIALDSPEKNFRHAAYPQYKEHRQKMPEDLSLQIPLIERLITAMNIPILKKPGTEADDLIACAAMKGVGEGFDVTIVSGDKDLMQLVGGKIKMLEPMKNVRYDAAGVKEKMGVTPGQIVDLLGLMGDASDNIPGVPGVGEKTARDLLEKYSTLEGVLKHATEITKPKLRQALTDNADLARLSAKLARLDADVEPNLNPTLWKLGEADYPKLTALYQELGFKSLLEDVAAPRKKEAERDFRTILSEDELSELVKKLKGCKGFAVDAETTSAEPVRAELVGISISYAEGTAYYVPLAHDYEGAPAQIKKERAIKILKPVLEDAKIEKFGQNIKYDMIVLASEGVKINPAAFDTMLASYVLSTDERRHNLSHLAEKYLGRTMREYSDVAGKGAKELPFNKVGVAEATAYSGDDAETTLALTSLFKKELEQSGLAHLYYDLELPLVSVLAKMEQNGILVDVKRLEVFSKKLEQQLAEMEKEIHSAAGEEFNISSPKQLSVILFDKLGLPKVRKTKTGQSTDQDVLETLAFRHPLPALVLRHRIVSKLKSTYLDPMPGMVAHSTGRIHTSFNQTVAATGRLSSSNPNLQNIPVRTEEGREIRRAFIAEKGNVLISADYSQMELRVLAHMSGDKLLTESFVNGEDVHLRTAREIFGRIGETTPEMRGVAKAVNFGIIYGQTAFGLSKELGVGRNEAQGFIDRYFARYVGVQDFIKSTIARAHEEKSVKTMMGRMRRLADLASANRTARELAERMAVNTVVQGTAADIIKKAMIEIDKKIEGTDLKMLLQIHDELIFECPKEAHEKPLKLIQKTMETVVKLNVPLLVSVGVADNWGDV
ncbi:MAG: DNA polymerase I [Nitrospinae bacterium]|nr:DNA polymerase I [Nitrospinota bacterium]